MNKIQKEYCINATQAIIDIPISVLFREKVNEQTYKDYSKIISYPMWLNEVERKLKEDEYKTIDQWKHDMEMIWKNAKKYNQDSFVSDWAMELKKVFDEMSHHVPSTSYEKWINDLEREQKNLAKLLRAVPDYYFPEVEKEEKKKVLTKSSSKPKI